MKGLVIVVLALSARVALADDEIVKGSVVKIEAKEIYVSIGADRGVASGAALRIKRPISLRNPVTHAEVDDWIPIGSAKVTEAAGSMSRAVVGDLVAQIKVGDIAEVYVDRPEPPRPAPGPGEAVDPVTAEVLGVFSAQSGQPLDVRIAAWEHYLSTRPTSPYAGEVRRDLETLHALRDQIQPRPAAEAEDVIVHVAHAAPASARAGVPLQVVFVLDAPERVASAYLHFRSAGSLTYQRALLAREHDIYLRGVIPAEVIVPPGFEYFVEVSAPDGASGLALGSPQQPIQVAVAAPPLTEKFASTPGRSSARLAMDYLDFATFDKRAGDRRDHMVQATADFTYRLDSAVESVGVGYGVYAGSGGYADRAWTMADPIPETAFQYGYADVEIGTRASGVHLSGGGQLIAGVGKQGFGMGVEGRVRLGDRDRTNLAVAARTVDQVGWVSDIRFGTRPIDGLLLGVSVGATNQPGGGDIGVRLAADVEVIAIDNMSVLLRGSWQGRTTDHGGAGAGAGVGFTW